LSECRVTCPPANTHELCLLLSLGVAGMSGVTKRGSFKAPKNTPAIQCTLEVEKPSCGEGCGSMCHHHYGDREGLDWSMPALHVL
jgi:hypothetical protein